MSVKTLINEIKFINENIKENKGVFTIKVKKLNLLLKYIDELEEENKKLKGEINEKEDIEFDMLKALNTDLDDDVEMG